MFPALDPTDDVTLVEFGEAATDPNLAGGWCFGEGSGRLARGFGFWWGVSE